VLSRCPLASSSGAFFTIKLNFVTQILGGFQETFLLFSRFNSHSTVFVLLFARIFNFLRKTMQLLRKFNNVLSFYGKFQQKYPKYQ
jgi:hypothetical protein